MTLNGAKSREEVEQTLAKFKEIEHPFESCDIYIDTIPDADDMKIDEGDGAVKKQKVVEADS